MADSSGQVLLAEPLPGATDANRLATDASNSGRKLKLTQAQGLPKVPQQSWGFPPRLVGLGSPGPFFLLHCI